MNQQLLDLLFESSSLRPDLLDKAKRVVFDIINNISLQDEIVTRVSDETYEFLKEIKK